MDPLIIIWITHLTFGDSFDQPVDNLPIHLTHLTFGNDFNRSLDKLPKNLTHLTFGNSFNQPINNLPKNILYITIPDILKKETKYLPEILYIIFYHINIHPIAIQNNILYEKIFFFKMVKEMMIININYHTNKKRYAYYKLII